MERPLRRTNDALERKSEIDSLVDQTISDTEMRSILELCPHLDSISLK